MCRNRLGVDIPKILRLHSQVDIITIQHNKCNEIILFHEEIAIVELFSFKNLFSIKTWKDYFDCFHCWNQLEINENHQLIKH